MESFAVDSKLLLLTAGVVQILIYYVNGGHSNISDNLLKIC